MPAVHRVVVPVQVAFTYPKRKVADTVGEGEPILISPDAPKGQAMLKYFSAALLAAGLLAAPAMAADATQPVTQQTLITKEVADKAVKPRPCCYRPKPKKPRGCCYHKKPRPCCGHHHPKKPKAGYDRPAPTSYAPAPKPYKPGPAKSTY